MTIDRWRKPRSNGDHLSNEEVELIRKGYRQGRSSFDIARELQCSTRTVDKYFVIFRSGCDVNARHRAVQSLQRTPKQVLQSRFYKGNFKL